MSIKKGEVGVGTSAIIIYQHHMLVGKRGPGCGHAQGLWSFPGGGLEYGETDIRQQVIREVQEEVGIDVGMIRPPYRPEIFTTNEVMEGCELHYITMYVPCFPENTGKIKLNKPIPHKEKHLGKGDEWVWMTYKQIVQTLTGEENPLVHEIYDKISKAQLQWLPLHLIMHYAAEMRLDIYETGAFS